jgi:hypothetical protein
MEVTMRAVILAALGTAVALSLTAPVRADESNKLTNFTFTKPVQLPGLRLEPGRYRFELADPVEGRRVIKVSTDDGQKQLGILLTIPNTLRDPAKDAVILFGESPASEPDAIKAWVYPGETIGYEFIYPHDEAGSLAKRYHTRVLSKKGEKLERVDETGDSIPDNAK